MADRLRVDILSHNGFQKVSAPTAPWFAHSRETQRLSHTASMASRSCRNTARVSNDVSSCTMEDNPSSMPRMSVNDAKALITIQLERKKGEKLLHIFPDANEKERYI